MQAAFRSARVASERFAYPGERDLNILHTLSCGDHDHLEAASISATANLAKMADC